MLAVTDLTKTFKANHKDVLAVDHVNLSFPDHGFVFIIGRSGSGKTTLISLLSGLLTPTCGKIILDGQELNQPLRSEKISVLFQEHNLIEDMTCKENLSLVCKDNNKIKNVLSELRMDEKANQKVSTLSGGERKRVSIGRSLLENTSVLVLDEPTANLDSKNATDVFNLLKEISKTKLILAVSHDKENAEKYGDFVYEMKEGKISPLKETTSNEAESKASQESISATKHNKMSPHFFLSFSQKTIWKRPWKTMGSLFLSCFSFALAALLSSLSFFQLDSSLSNAFRDSGSSFIPIASLHPEDLASKTIEKTEALFPSFLPSLPSTENKTKLNLQIFPYQEGMKIKGQEIQSPKRNSCVTTTLVSELAENSVSIDWGENENRPFAVAETIDSGDLTEIKEWYQQSKNERGQIDSSSEFYSISQRPSYVQSYGFVVLNEEDFMDVFAYTAPISLPASDFLLSYAYDDFTYATKDVKYASYISETLSYGRAPKEEGEAVVSEGFFKHAAYALDSDDPSSILNKTFYYRDLSNSFSNVPVRMDLLYPSITIVGISPDDTSQVYMYSTDFKKATGEIVYSQVETFALNNDPSSLAKILSQNKNDYSTSLNGTSPSYFLESTKTSPIFPYIVASTVVLLVLSTVFTMMVCSENVDIRKREIALLESLGISKKSIQGCFLFQNGISGLGSFLVALALVYPSLYIVNAVLKSPSVFGVSYNVLTISPLSILIGFACYVLATLLSTVLPLIRISKIDILEVLKKN